MSVHLQREIDRVKKSILALCAIVEDQVQASVRALLDRDVKLAETVEQRDDDIDHREVEIEELEPVRKRYLLERSGGNEVLVRQELAVPRRLAAAGEMRFFAAVAEGEIRSFCELYSDDSGVAVVRSVATLKAHRRAGLARATVSHAVQRSRALGYELTFLRAVHDDWPKNLYGELGFDAVGMIYRFAGRPAVDAR